MRKLLIMSLVFLSACGGDDDVTSVSKNETESNESAQSSFTSKPTQKQLLALLKEGSRYDIKLTKGTGWNTTQQMRNYWHKNYNYKDNANINEFPKATVLIDGEFRFQINGSNYDLDTIRSVDAHYFGLPLPSDETMQKLLDVDLSNILREKSLIGEIIGPILPQNDEQRNVKWPKPNAFIINVDVTFSQKKGQNKLQTQRCRIPTRFNRKSINDKFHQVIGDTPKCKTIEVKPYSPQELNQLKTHQELEIEKLSQIEFSQLIDIDIPEFDNDKEAIDFIYRTLYNGNKATVKAMILKMFTPKLFVNGSSTQISYQAQEMFDQTFGFVFAEGVNFQNSYCPQMLLKSYQPNYAVFVDALNKTRFRVIVEEVGGTFKIRELDLYIVRSARDIATLNSKSLDALCDMTAQTVKVFKG